MVLDSSGDLFGDSGGGGEADGGTVFEIPSRSGTVVTLASLDAASGEGPDGIVAMDSSGDFFGTAGSDGTNRLGTVFEVPELKATATAVTSNNTSTAYGQPVTFTANVTPIGASGETGTVQFQIDGSNAGSPMALTGNTASYTTSTLNAGTHSVVAVYSGDNYFAASTSPTLIQNVGQAVLSLSAGAAYIKLDAAGQNMDVWTNANGTGTPNQCCPCGDYCGVTYAGPPGGDIFVFDYSNGDPLPAGGISLTGGAGQNTLEIIGDPSGNNDAVAIDGGAFTIPAGTLGAGTANYSLGTVSIAAGASLALGQSDSQADQTVFTVNDLSVAGTLDIGNNTLLANETNVPLSQVAAWVQNGGIMSSLVSGLHAIASRAVGYGDSIHIPLTVPAGDVEVKYVPTGDANLDGVVDITDITRAINDLGQAVGYSGGDILNQGSVNINDINGIINDLGANLNASGDGASVAAVQASAGAVTPAALAHAAVRPPAAGGLVGSLFSDTRIAGDWLESAGSVLGE